MIKGLGNLFGVYDVYWVLYIISFYFHVLIYHINSLYKVHPSHLRVYVFNILF